MKILVNATNLKKGGGLQVADSVCVCLNRFPVHRFVVVLSRALEGTAVCIKGYPNVKVVRYDLPKTVRRVLTGRDKFLDGLVEESVVYMGSGATAEEIAVSFAYHGTASAPVSLRIGSRRESITDA